MNDYKNLSEHVTEMSNYALAKHVPSMASGFVIKTNYGEIIVSSDEAAPFLIATIKLMNKRIKAVKKLAKGGAK